MFTYHLTGFGYKLPIYHIIFCMYMYCLPFLLRVVVAKSMCASIAIQDGISVM